MATVGNKVVRAVAAFYVKIHMSHKYILQYLVIIHGFI